MEPLSAQIADLEEAIEYLVRRNDVVDEQIQGIKADLVSLTDKILAIKVSFIYKEKILYTKFKVYYRISMTTVINFFISGGYRQHTIPSQNYCLPASKYKNQRNKKWESKYRQWEW